MAYGQPSPQGIAKLYRGNPEMLDARVKQEQQSKPGMPPDLAKLMALSINVNEEDAVKRQEALNALQGMQMQAPTGKPPTVAESLQQQAMQKAKQLAVQQQQQQKGLQALMGQAAPTQAPERPPQPERQGSIDELESNLGTEYAGGGIVAFRTGDEVEDPDVVTPKAPLRQVTQRELAEEYNRKRFAQKAEEDAARSPEAKKDSEGIGKALSFVAGLPIEALKTLVSAPGYGFSKNEAPALATPATDPATIRAQLNAAEGRMQPAAPAAPVKDLAALAEQKKRAQNAAAPAKPATPAAPAAPAEMSDYEKLLSDAMKLDPTKQRADALARRKAEIGDIDTSAQEAYIKSLQGRLGGLEEPTDMYDRARAHLRRLATAGGRTSFETGANASVAMQKEREAAEQQKMALLKEIMGESTKVVDLKRGEKEKAFTFAEKEYDEAYKRAYDAAKEQGLNVRDRERFAHQSAENALNRASNERVANIRSEAASGAGGDKAVQQAEAAFARDPEAQAIKKMLESPIYSMNPAKAAPLLTKLRAIQASKYAQFDRTIAEAPGAAASSPGGTRPPLSSFQR